MKLLKDFLILCKRPTHSMSYKKLCNVLTSTFLILGSKWHSKCLSYFGLNSDCPFLKLQNF